MVGNDIEKIYGKSHLKNIDKLANTLTPTEIKIGDASDCIFSSHSLKLKLRTLLVKFSQIYELMMESRPLCRHEIALLKIRCISMGNWFPVNFPSDSLKRKFHILTYHVPEKAEKFRTVGMHAEHISESIHLLVNKLKHR